MVKVQGPKHVLSVSYNESLLHTRELLLRSRGYKVTSGLGFTNAVAACKAARFDLFILGHSIPRTDKAELIRTFRKYCPAPVVSLLRPDETLEDEADGHVSPHDPKALLDRIDEILEDRADAVSGSESSD
ncbi:MAG TPA: hypothetical protein VFU50_14770 [Terriglobales bacterium]|nr:hypothetical protein [Terriglobales bacterium]